MEKLKLLMISDHALSPSGVGVQTKLLIEGLLEKNKYTFLQLGAAVKHDDLSNIKVKEDFYIKPINGFGNPNLIRSILLNEKPDALILFTDARFFEYIFKMEDEIHQVCPILWWHVWDNNPYPKFNEWIYNSVDTINCHSYLTYKLLKENLDKESINYIPHSYPSSMFFKIDKEKIINEKIKILGENNKDSFICLWINRNCKRKRPSDVIKSWSIFINSLEEKEKSKCILLMHTNPEDKAGPNLFSVIEYFKMKSNVMLSSSIIDTDILNILYNISDCTINISFNEGFGLTTLESMMTGTPIISSKTGGLTYQVIDHSDNSENGVSLDIDTRVLNGNQKIPYIYEDYVSCENIVKGIKKYYNFSKKKKEKLSVKVSNFSKKDFNYEKSINEWDKSIEKAIFDFKNRKNLEIINC
jgi:glycosyltransferase involved in cell wall biosynthesis